MPTVQRELPVFTNDPEGKFLDYLQTPSEVYHVSLANVANSLLRGEAGPVVVMLDFVLGTVELLYTNPEQVMEAYETSLDDSDPIVGNTEVFGVPVGSNKSILWNTLKRQIGISIQNAGTPSIGDIVDPATVSLTLGGLIDRMERGGEIAQALIIQAPALTTLAPIAPEGAVIATTDEGALFDYLTMATGEMFGNIKVTIPRDENPTATPSDLVFE